MKKIFVSMLAVAITFGSFAQSENNDQKETKKEWKQKGKQDMQEKLNLTDAQKAQMKTMNESFRTKMQNLKQDNGLSEDVQKQKRNELIKEHSSQVQSILTPEQKKQWEASRQEFGSKRMKGDHRQGKSNKKFDRGQRYEEMTKDLNLSGDQSARLKVVNQSFKTSVQNIRSNSTLSSDEKKEQIKDLQKKHKQEMDLILTAEQKEQMKSNFKNRKDRGADKVTR